MNWIQGRHHKDTVSSFVKVPPQKKSCPASTFSDLSLSSSGGNPHVKTCREKKCNDYAEIRVEISEVRINWSKFSWLKNSNKLRNLSSFYQDLS